MAKDKIIAEFGDFQTPPGLAKQVCARLAARGLEPASLLEPTCGLGSLLFAGLDQFAVRAAVGADINANYIKWAQIGVAKREDCANIALREADFFATDWEAIIRDLPEPLLILGNPPWVTNAHLMALRSTNLPEKSNFQKHSGIDAITGKANFDICEWMLIRLVEAMNERRGCLAMLCKAAVARKVLRHGWKHGMSFSGASIIQIDANLHFGASVDAALLVIDFQPGASDRTAEIFPSLSATASQRVIGYEDAHIIADLEKYRDSKHLCGVSPLQWRSGIKHDCSKVMELRREGAKYRNALGDLVELEDDFVYPMLKSSDLANGARSDRRRWMIVTQQRVGDDTSGIALRAPKTWSYLTKHADRFAKRGSSIYRDRPLFSIFGVGEYSFSPWKVAISGFYKRLTFAAIGEVNGKPTMLDDTSYFIPCQTADQAEYLASLLNSRVAQAFFDAFIFWDAKRPITADLLRRLDLRALARELGRDEVFTSFFGTESSSTIRTKRKRHGATLALWPE